MGAQLDKLQDQRLNMFVFLSGILGRPVVSSEGVPLGRREGAHVDVAAREAAQFVVRPQGKGSVRQVGNGPVGPGFGPASASLHTPLLSNDH